MLAVDDNKFMRTVVENICRGLGIVKFAQADNVDLARVILRRDPIDLVITDWHMEPTDGLQFVKFLRNDPKSPNPYVPVIMLTGHGDRERYFGPDRRRQDIGAPAGMTERRAGGVEARTKTG